MFAYCMLHNFCMAQNDTISESFDSDSTGADATEYSTFFSECEPFSVSSVEKSNGTRLKFLWTDDEEEKSNRTILAHIVVTTVANLTNQTVIPFFDIVVNDLHLNFNLDHFHMNSDIISPTLPIVDGSDSCMVSSLTAVGGATLHKDVSIFYVVDIKYAPK